MSQQSMTIYDDSLSIVIITGDAVTRPEVGILIGKDMTGSGTENKV
jgi:hypothetical protein